MADQTTNTGAQSPTGNGNDRWRTPNASAEFAVVMSRKAARQVEQVGFEGVAPSSLMMRKLLLAWRRLNVTDEQLFDRQAWVAGANQDYAAHAQQVGEVLKQIEKIIEDGLKVLGRPVRKKGSAQTTQPVKGVTLK